MKSFTKHMGPGTYVQFETDGAGNPGKVTLSINEGERGNIYFRMDLKTGKIETLYLCDDELNRYSQPEDKVYNLGMAAE